MPQARAFSIIMSLARCKDGATRGQGRRGDGCTGKRHLSAPEWASWQHGKPESWHNRVVSHSLFQAEECINAAVEPWNNHSRSASNSKASLSWSNMSFFVSNATVFTHNVLQKLAHYGGHFLGLLKDSDKHHSMR